MNGQPQAEEMSTQSAIWREIIKQRWSFIQKRIAEQEFSLTLTDDPATVQEIERGLRGLKIAAMGVWWDAKEEQVTLSPPTAQAKSD